MTKEILSRLAKKANVELEQTDAVFSYLNTKYTYIITIFYVIEVLGGERKFFNIGETRTRFADVLKREEFDDDYYTNGIQRTFEIK